MQANGKHWTAMRRSCFFFCFVLSPPSALYRWRVSCFITCFSVRFRLCVCAWPWLSAIARACLSVYLFVCLSFTCLLVCLPSCFSVCLSVCRSICLSVSEFLFVSPRLYSVALVLNMSRHVPVLDLLYPSSPGARREGRGGTEARLR